MAAGLLGDFTITPEEKELLVHFCTMHDMPVGKAHDQMLENLGWTKEQFEQGRKDDDASPKCSLSNKKKLRATSSAVSITKAGFERALSETKKEESRAEKEFKGKEERILVVREIILYIIFMCVFTASNARFYGSETVFAYTTGLRDLLVQDSGFRDVRSREGAAEWLTGGFAAALAAEVRGGARFFFLFFFARPVRWRPVGDAHHTLLSPPV